MMIDWSWAIDGITDEVPRTTGPECINYMTNRRRWIETVFFTIFFICLIRWTVKRMDPIVLPPQNEIDRPHSMVRLFLLIAMTWIFGIEMGFKLAGKSVIFVMNPCHIQTIIQIYLLAAKPSKTTIALFRIQMNNLNGPFLAFILPEVECRTLPFEQATYWVQHALLYIIPVYILKSGAYKIEDFYDYNWVTIGVAIMLLYHFVVLNAFSIGTGINLNHMLCAAMADPFQGQNYRIAAVIHESILCPILNKVTVLVFCSDEDVKKSRQMPLQKKETVKQQQQQQQKHQEQMNLHLQENSNYRQINTKMATASLSAKKMEFGTENALLYHQKKLMPAAMESGYSLADEMNAAMNMSSDDGHNVADDDHILLENVAATLRHRAGHTEDGNSESGSDANANNDDMLMFTPTGPLPKDSFTAALDKEVEMLLLQQNQQKRKLSAFQADCDYEVAEYPKSTMPTTKID